MIAQSTLSARIASGPGPGSGDDVTAPAKPKTVTRTKLERPKLYKVLLLNDDYTPRDFVVMVLEAEFGMGEDRATQVMLTAHRKGSCVISVYPRDVAETKVQRANEYGKKFGFPLQFIAEPEE
ncbi:ATP-dependent Clp protease adapter ClpS [Pararhizobium haloflavum]|uniref:ATP-dependent Clp protease adapter ClpS n=1 Tax=Pararhizobium haloflavum TaxID=2037914 RepID=UPI000C1A369A|nr:ATP-dependent Clp protease adapter ClpS [Pararhizobium haloflavum]